MTTPTPIDDQARALMSAWVEQREPSPELQARTWAAVSARAQAGELGPELGPDVSASAATPLGGAARLRLALVGLGVTGSIVALVFAVGSRPDPSHASEPADARATMIDDEPDEPAAVATVEPAPKPGLPSPAAPALTPPPPTPEPKPAASSPSRPPTTKPTAGPKPTPESPSSGPPADDQDDLAAELALLGRARAALKSGDPKAALALLDQHAREFPRGALRSERELSRITAACSADELDRAEQVARRFIREHPGSTEAKRLADTCIGDRI